MRIATTSPTADWPVFDEGTEFGTAGGRRRQQRRVVADDARQHLKVGLAVAVGRVAGGQFDQRDAQRPHVGADVVVRMRRVRRLDPLRRHVRRAAGAPRLRLRRSNNASQSNDIYEMIYTSASYHNDYSIPVIFQTTTIILW